MSFADVSEVPYARLVSGFQDLEISEEEEIGPLKSDSTACSSNRSDFELDIFAGDDSITGFGDFGNQETEEDIVNLIECVDLTGDDQETEEGTGNSIECIDLTGDDQSSSLEIAKGFGDLKVNKDSVSPAVGSSVCVKNDGKHDLKLAAQPRTDLQLFVTIQEIENNWKSSENLNDPTKGVKMDRLSLDGRVVIGKRYWSVSPRDDGFGKVDLSVPFQGDETNNMRDCVFEFESSRNNQSRRSPKEIRPRSSPNVTSENRKRSVTELSSDRRLRPTTNSPNKRRRSTTSSSEEGRCSSGVSSDSSEERHKRSWCASRNLSRDRRRRSSTNSLRKRGRRSSSYLTRERRRRSESNSPRERRRLSASNSPRERRRRSESNSPRERRRRSGSNSPRERRRRSGSNSPRERRRRSESNSPRERRRRSESNSPRRRRRRSASYSSRERQRRSLSNASRERGHRDGSHQSSRSKYRRRSPIVRIRRTLVFDKGLDNLNSVRKPSRSYWSCRKYYERNDYSRSRRSFTPASRSRSRYRSRSRSTATRRR